VNKKIDTVLFDLDGTLIDTAPDMVAALNRLLQRYGKPALPFAGVRNLVSRGSLALLQLAFGADLPADKMSALQTEYLNVYAEDLCKASRPFAGMPAILDRLQAGGIPWGVVTNKPGWLTEPLLHQLDLDSRAGCVISGDSLPQRKPHPAPLLHAAELLQRKPAQCVYIGDDRRDVEAGRAAGMSTVVAQYGYIEAQDDPRLWGADVMITSVDHLQDWLQQHVL
jgi:2-phosphoglycolate phosphatase